MADAASRYQVPGQRLNLTDAFLHKNLREGRADKTALIVDHLEHGVRHLSYQQVADRAGRMASWLAAQGIGLEHRVLIVLPDGEDWVTAFFGALQVGATVLFLNHRVSAEELAFYLKDSRARCLLTHSEVVDRCQPNSPSLTTAAMDAAAFTDGLNACDVMMDCAETLEEDFAVWLYSSGSTGAPKAAVHRAYDFIYNTERYAQDVLHFTESDITLSVPKLFFGYATGTNLLFPFYYGGTAVLFGDRPTPDRLYGLIEKHKPTILVNVPTLIAQLQTTWDERGTKPDVSSLRLTTSAGEALPAELYKRWMAGAGVEVLDGIGSAEMFHVFISARLGEVRPGSLGTLVRGYNARIVDGDEQPLPTGEVGRLWIQGGSAAAFYWNRHEISRSTLRGDWVVSSDLFRQDDDGHFYYEGRAGDVMKVGGRWLSPLEVEGVLTAHDAVAEAGVACFTQDGLTKPMAFVALRPGFEDSEDLGKTLSAYVASKLAPYKAPRFVVFCSNLPRGDRDKIDRKALAKMAQEHADGSPS